MCFDSYIAPIYRPPRFYTPPTQLYANRVIPGQAAPAVCVSPRRVFFGPNQRNFVPRFPVFVDSGSRETTDPRANLGARCTRLPVNPPPFNFWNRVSPPRFPWGMAGHRVTVGR